MKKIAIRSLWALGLIGLLLGGAALFAKPSARREAPQEPASQQKPTPKPEEQKPAENKTEAQLEDLPEPKQTGVFAAYQERAQKLLDQMTPEQKIGQVFLVRCPEDSQLKETQALHPGGLLLFGRDFKGKTADQVRQTIQGYQQTSQTPLFIGADEEGGTVCRVSGNPGLRAERFPSPQQLYQAGGLEAAEADGVEKSRLLLSLGINLNLAPVADVSQNPQDFIYPRTWGQDAESTAQYVATTVQTAQKEGVGAVMKHFPGYGGNADTHTGSARDNRPLSQFEQADLRPFQAGIEAGGQGILVSHNIVECLDPQRPASISPAVYQYLRKEMGFTGVALTDDLAMGAMKEGQEEHPAVQALRAGADFLIVSELPSAASAVGQAIEQGTLSQARVDQAALRVLEWKLALGILE